MSETSNETRDGAEAGEPLSAGASAELAEACAARDEYRASWQRAQADYQNLRRRLSSETDAAVSRSKTGLLGELLLVLDYLEMALAAPCSTPEGRNLHAGVELTKQQLWRVLEREGLKLVPEQGRFDAAVHDAVERIETEEHEEGTILATLRRGYTLGGQILRPAQVKVAVPPSSAPERAQRQERG